MMPRRWLLLVVVAALLAAFLLLDLGRYLNLELVRSQQAVLRGWYESQPLATAAAFFLLYVTIATLSLPAAWIVTVAAGAIFGLLVGTVIVSFASSIGATLAFLGSRYLFRDAVQARFHERLAAVNRGIERDGALYLFTLRLVPLLPFFAVNLLMGLTPIRTGTYYVASQLGMLFHTTAYVYAGTQIAQIRSVRDVFSPGLLLAFAAIGVLPLIARKAIDRLQARRVYAGWPRPARFDRNLVVIGAGSAGLVAAYIAAAVRARVTLVEKHRMGGDCLNTGCVPSKAMIRTSRLLASLRQARALGLRRAEADFDFGEVMERVQRVVARIEPHDSVARYSALGVECVQGEATIRSPWSVEVRAADGTQRTLTTRGIVIAAGARPLVPPIPGLEEIGYLTSDTVWSLRTLPARLLVLGGGPVGCELAQAFARFGAKVVQVEKAPRIMTREDPEVSVSVTERFRAEGIEVLVGHEAKRFERDAGEKVLVAECEGREVRIAFDSVLLALGRVANTAGYGLETLGIPVSGARRIEVDEFMATRFPNIYACGDVASPYQFTHVAAHTAWYAAVNALFGSFRRYRADFDVIPWATFTDPEVARVGLNETEAKAKGIACEVTRYGIDDLDRAIADGAAYGFVKVLTMPGKDTILGATIVGEQAAELIGEFVTAMRHDIGLNQILGTIHVYPTLAEANKYVAGNWKRARVTRGQWAVLEAFQAWRRGETGVAALLGRLPALFSDKRRAYDDPALDKA
jgi:pyruvate/2-oxoglutarate dehydrogenase complex dihydrolipoamide dehydrogenase (E3) component/uncharacterized membrane protein YdjX (TVP38/TMEM64 family)